MFSDIFGREKNHSLKADLHTNGNPMRIISFFIVVIFITLAAGGIASAALPAEHTADEWRSILSVSRDDGSLTGIQIKLGIEPDQYYLQNGSGVNLSGILTNVFGPIPNADVILARGIEAKPAQYQNMTTDENGIFSYSDLINSTGTVRYQVWYEGSDRKKTNLTKSNEIEIRSEANKTNQSTDMSAIETPDNLTSDPVTVQEPESSDGDAAISERVSPSEVLTLQGEPETFVSGQNMTFNGGLTSDGKGISHIPVMLETKAGNDTYFRIGDVLTTDRNGTYNTAYHLTGPYDPTIRAVSVDEKGNNLLSEILPLTFQDEQFSPPAREIRDTRSIDASMFPSAILTNENVTISGWFADGNGDGIPYGILNIYWYNFSDRIWDRYKANAEIITNKDGFFAGNISGPTSSGLSYMAVVSAKEKTGKPLFSQILPLTVRDPESTNSSVMPARLTGEIDPPTVAVSQQAQITFALSDPQGSPLAGEPVTMFFSEDGFTWFMNGSGNVTTRSDGTVAMTDTPKRPGFHYYRGVYDGSDLYGPADSGVLALVITSPESSAT